MTTVDIAIKTENPQAVEAVCQMIEKLNNNEVQLVTDFIANLLLNSVGPDAGTRNKYPR